MQPYLRLGFLLMLSCFFVVKAEAQVYGCKDPNATNYNAAATHNDGSCVYPSTTITANQIALLNDTLKETSGLAYWNGLLWTHNDDTDPNIYAIDTTDGHIVRTVKVLNFANKDCEEITQDDSYFYLGDFGNNGNGNRQDLRIYRLAKSGLNGTQTTITPDSILFSYQDQLSFTGTGNNNTDFDCESFIVSGDSLYLFNKQWVSNKTKIYVVPKVPGTYVAVPKAEYDVAGLVTGASFYNAKKVVVLCGYMSQSALYQPFVLMLYDFQGNQFLSGNKRKILVNPLLHQTEGISTANGHSYFLSNEKKVSTSPSITIPNKLQKIDLSTYLTQYYTSLGIGTNLKNGGRLTVYPNPAAYDVHVRVTAGKATTAQLSVINVLGQIVAHTNYQLDNGDNELLYTIPTTVQSGIYWISLSFEDHSEQVKIILNK